MLMLGASPSSVMDAGVPTAAGSYGLVRLAHNYILQSGAKEAPTRSGSPVSPTNANSPRMLECSVSSASRAAAGDNAGLAEWSPVRRRAAPSLPCGAPTTSATPPSEKIGHLVMNRKYVLFGIKTFSSTHDPHRLLVFRCVLAMCVRSKRTLRRSTRRRRLVPAPRLRRPQPPHPETTEPSASAGTPLAVTGSASDRGRVQCTCRAGRCPAL